MGNKHTSSVLDEFVVKRTPPGCTQLTGEDNHPRNYTTTLYDDNGKLVDDGDLRFIERTYWEQFVDKDTAAELKRRLELLETDDYFPQPGYFEPMEATGGEEDDSS